MNRQVGPCLKIAEPDSAWSQRYVALAADVASALGDRVLDIQHVGEGLGFVHWLTGPDGHQRRLFRDWLIAHPEGRDRYAAAKRLAAADIAAPQD